MMAIMTRKLYSHTVAYCSVWRNHYVKFYNLNSTYLCKWFVNVSNHNQHSLSKLTETEVKQTLIDS